MYIGKFQPFHNGHRFAIKDILTKVDALIIVIGSSQYSGEANLPFSAAERRQMIEQTLTSDGLENCSIVELTDIHDDYHWVEHVVKYVGHFDLVFSNNQLVQRLFRQQNFIVKSIRKLPGVSGTLIRRKIEDNDNSWIKLVPEASSRIIQSRS
jgi:nicotinamide-nucleotide adenylyltransferase